MKIFSLIVLMLAACFAISAQVSKTSSATDLIVVRQSWRFQVSANPSTEKTNSDPFRANNEQREFARATLNNMQENRIRAAQGLPLVDPPSRENLALDYKNSVKTGDYIYQAEVKNTGQKTIRSFTWDYVFFDKTKNLEAGRRHFTSTKKIRPGETKKLSEKSFLYPTNTIDAAQGDKKFNQQYSEQIIIQKITYSDGSVWNAPSN